ncbi:MAG TPA: ABC transporter permease [Acidimicrobiales bacterium]|nr:ABC transporter permease [Acidimicrobiales bacterium]
MSELRQAPGEVGDDAGGGAPDARGRHPLAAPAEVRVAGGRWRDDLRAVQVVWRRELIRFGRNRLRIVTSLVQPVLFLFVLGTGLSSLVAKGVPAGSGVSFRTFMFPGVVAMTVLFTSIFSAVSIVWDREFGFLREMLVAPVRRGALVAGKCAGGATVATLQALIMLVLCGLVGVPYSPVLLLTLAGEMLLAAVAVTALGTALASRMAQVESFQVVMQFVVLPLFFLSGALFPLRALPAWLSVLTRLDPLAYIVDPMRRAVFAHVHTTPAVTRVFGATMTWGSYHLPIWLELLLTAAFALLMLVLAVANFSKSD